MLEGVVTTHVGDRSVEVEVEEYLVRSSWCVRFGSFGSLGLELMKVLEGRLVNYSRFELICVYLVKVPQFFVQRYDGGIL